MKNKALVVCTQMEAGGVQVLALNLKNEAIKRSFPLKIVFLYKKRPAFVEGVDVCCLLDRKPKNIFDYFYIFYRLACLMRAERPEVVVGFAHYSSAIACIFGMIFGAQVRIGTQTTPPYVLNRVAKFLDLFAARIGAYTKNVAASNFVLSFFESYPEWYKKKSTVIYNGVAVLPPDCSRDQFRARFGIPLSSKLLLNSGRLSLVKNQKFIIDLVLEMDNVCLAIAGGGELQEYLTNYVNEIGLQHRVFFLGELDAQDVSNFLHAGDLYVFPSKYEAFGVALAEAMMIGLPVIANDYPALREVVGDSGLLISVESPLEWRDGIVNLLSDSDLYRKYSSMARVQANKFDMGQMFTGFFE